MNYRLIPVFIFILLVVTAIACGGKKVIEGENKSEAGRLFTQSCQTCHTLPKATMKTDEEWPEIVARYGPRAKLNKSQISAITSYLIANN